MITIKMFTIKRITLNFKLHRNLLSLCDSADCLSGGDGVEPVDSAGPRARERVDQQDGGVS